MLAELPLTTPWQSPDTYSSFHLYVVRLNLQVARESQKKIHALLLKNGIGANLHYIPVYLQPYYQNLGFKVGHCPEAEKYFHEAITLPMYPGLTQESQFKVVDVLRKCL
jgi:dTDP-4-amino-4,6-dideoxygalactose transaminase